jgi:O-glycosyl hydrolase|tara:strand:- start:4176 stop:4814 length:639 start_codon:yes stop_codon:yes gene_type:complete
MLKSSTLKENLSYDQAQIITETSQDGKNLFMQGIFVQGEKRNQNQRVYPVSEISKAVKSIQEKIEGGFSILGEADHPDDLQVNLDRVSHMIEKMWMDGQDGYGRLKLLPTPMGNICKTLLDNGVKLGVSSRGSGNVTESGNVSDFEIQTVDIVANPSAPDAYPDPLYEQIMNGKRGNVLMDVASAVNNDKLAEQYFQKEVQKFIEKLDIRRK